MSSWLKYMYTRANNFANNRPYPIPTFRTSRTTTAVRNNLRNRYGKKDRRKYRHFKSRFYNIGYKWLMRFANNNFNFKFDFIINCYIISAYARKIGFKVANVATQDEINLCDTFYGNNGDVESQWGNLSKLYKYYRIAGVKIRYKACQTVDSQNFRPGISIADQSAANMPSLYRKHIPNIMVQIMTQHEHAAFAVPANEKDFQRQIDRPYSRVISADDDAKFYRSFPNRPNYDSYLNQNDDVLFHVVPTTQNNAQIYLRFLLTEPYESNPQYDWPLGTIHVTIYSTFKNSTI